MKGLHIQNSKIAVVGFGVSGKAIASFFLKNGIGVDVFEDKTEDKFDQQTISAFVTNDLFSIYFANTSADIEVGQYDYVIASPGVPLTHALVQRAAEAGVEFVTDITVFLRLFRVRYPHGKVISITGSNGKSTTVSLMRDALLAAGLDTYLGGNIGTSPLDFFDEIKTEKPVIILETSSYQLEYLKPEDYFDIAGITNISDNHLDRYQGRKELYAKAKLGGISSDHTDAIINLDDAETQKFIVPFLPTKHVLGVQFESGFAPNVISLENNSLVHRTEEGTKIIVGDVRNMRIKGMHNVYNCAFTAAVMALLEVELTPAFEDAIYNFAGLEHRVQFVDEINGITYINDSKSTTPASTKIALEAASKSKDVLLITGGDDKGMPYEPLLETWNEVVKGIVLLPGSANPKLKMLAERSGVPIMAEVLTMQEAVDVMRGEATEGDTVLLSPATASFASFRSFEDRGNQFIECVRNLRA